LTIAGCVLFDVNRTAWSFVLDYIVHVCYCIVAKLKVFAAFDDVLTRTQMFLIMLKFDGW